jgi:hypothetical protein
MVNQIIFKNKLWQIDPVKACFCNILRRSKVQSVLFLKSYSALIMAGYANIYTKFLPIQSALGCSKKYKVCRLGFLFKENNIE